MKACSQCQRLYTEDAGFCPVDGVALVLAGEVPVDLDPEDETIGQRICGGRYEVRRKVADGGMGRVYQALDLEEGRSVAIKVLHPEVAMDEVQVERFKREYKLSASLPHEHIVHVLNFHTTEDDSYALVMEYLEGEELRMFLQREKLCPPERMIRVLSQLAIGLQQPHERKQVHRDIKPDNIFLCGTEDGSVAKLLDFGSVRDNSDGAKKLTVVGTTIGSPYYMSPEQAQGLPGLDHRADIWSLAAIAYESLTGKVPFYGTTGPQILLAILQREPEPLSILSNSDDFEGKRIPEAVDDVLADALTKDPMIRISSVADLADAFGSAYGMAGSHLDWAYLPEPDIAELIEPAIVAAIAAVEGGQGEILVHHSEQARAMQEPSAEPSPVQDDVVDELMGLPKGPPMGLIVMVVLVVSAIVAAVIWSMR